MSFGKISMLAVTAMSLVSAPVLAQAANPAASLSVARTGAKIGKKSEVAGSSLLLLLLAAAAVVGGAIIIADDDDEPASP